MKPEDFVSGVRRTILNEHLEIYRGFLRDRIRNPEQDTPWQKIFQCWDSLDDAQREAILQFVRIAMVESIAGLLGLIDNVAFLDGYRESFQLNYGPAQEKISGELQDYFLAAEEEEPPETLWQE